MPIMQKERVISLLDLRWLCVTCEKCKTSPTMDMNRESPGIQPGNFSNFAPSHCSMCGEPFDSAVTNLHGLHVVFRAMFKFAEANPDVITFIATDPGG